MIDDTYLLDYMADKGYYPLHYYFVDVLNGNDDTGVIDDETKPFKTWEGVHTDVAPGDAVIYRGGTHDIQINGSYPSINGTSENPIIIMTYPGEAAIIDRLSAGIYLRNCSNITLDGLTCQNMVTKLGRGVMMTESSNIILRNIDSGYSANGLFAMQDLHNILVENCVFHDTDFAGTHGVYLGSRDLPNSNITFKNNLIYNAGMTGFQHNGRVTNLICENNIIHSCNMAAISLLMGVSGGIFRNNLCFNNNQGVVIYNYVSTAPESGILPYDQDYNQFINNTFWVGKYRHASGDHNVVGPEYFSAIHYNCNINDPYTGLPLPEFERSFDNNVFRNNIFVTDAGSVFRFEQQDFLDTTIIENNVIYRYGDYRYDGPDCVLNYGGGYNENYNFEFFQNFSNLIKNNVYAWPEFINVSIDYATTPEMFNFKLLSNSPAIDFGIYDSAPIFDIQGINRTGNPDAGCYEYVSDICTGVVCDDVCIGTDLYSQKCDPNTGNCITDQLLETNSVSCGFVFGDLNDDGILDINDYPIIRDAIGKYSNETGYISRADYDNNDYINYSDFKIWYGYYKNK